MKINSFSEYCFFLREKIEDFLKSIIFPELESISHPLLYDSIYYCLNGGKRIRPILCLSTFLSSEEQNLNDDILYLSISLECIHTYSLIHDDLPSMDNDDYRRNLPSCHKKFGENIAILTGDALNSYAFFLLSKINHHKISQIIHVLHKGAGLNGMISGQMYDILSEGKFNHKEKILYDIYNKKTAALITTSLILGAILNGNFTDKQINLLEQYGQKLGFLFQLKDDILDIEGEMEVIGKTPGKDEKAQKLTYPSFFGLEESYEKTKHLIGELITISNSLFPNNIFFQELPNYIVQRKN